MGRPRAGHSWAVILVNNKRIDLIQNDAGQWVTSGEAKDWRRCPRCRSPFESDPFNSGLCVMCYFYKNGLSSKRFWQLHNSGYRLAPYNIGKRCMNNTDTLRALRDNPHWRTVLREQRADYST